MMRGGRSARTRTAVGRLAAALLLLGLPRSGLAEEPAQASCPKGTSLARSEPKGSSWCQRPDGTQHGPSFSWYPGGQPRAVARFDAGELDGRYREWHRNGKLREESHYKKGLRHGTTTRFDEAGTKRSEEPYRNGKLHGESRVWHPNGQLFARSSYENGERHGNAETWYADGTPQTKGQFARGAYHGTWIGWWENGQKKKVAEFDSGKELTREFFERE